jgi:hypothetical protein
VQNGKYKKHRAQQEFVGYGVEILTEQSLLMKPAGKKPVEAIAEACDYEDDKGPEIAAFDQMDHDERQENHS